MHHHFYQLGPGLVCPMCNTGIPFMAGQCLPQVQTHGWPYFGAHWPGRPFHPYGYSAAPTGPMSDDDIRGLVAKYLSKDPRLSPQAEIAVDVRGRVVTLTGTVPDKWTKYVVGEDCFNVPAVADVNNKLRIAESLVTRKRREERGEPWQT